MNKIFVLFSFAMLIAPVSQAADSKRTLEYVERFFGAGNGSTQVVRYNVRTFNARARTLVLNRALPTTRDCAYGTLIGVQPLARLLTSRPIFNDQAEGAPNAMAQAMAVLARMDRAGQLAFVVGRVMTDNIERDSYCDIYNIEIYARDGYVLSLNLDYTD